VYKFYKKLIAVLEPAIKLKIYQILYFSQDIQDIYRVKILEGSKKYGFIMAFSELINFKKKVLKIIMCRNDGFYYQNVGLFFVHR